MSNLYCLLFLALLPALAFSQTTEQKVEVTYEQSPTTGDYVFKAVNPNACDYTVQVDVVDLVGMKASVSLPYINTVKPGSSNLFSLKPNAMGAAPSFRYLYRAWRGRLYKSPPPPFVYLLPVSPSKPVLVQEAQPVVAAYGLKIGFATSFYSLAFHGKAGDTVFAARRGLVINRSDGYVAAKPEGWNLRDVNFIEIAHADGTFGAYTRLKSGTLLVKDGETVEAGQPLAIMADDLGPVPMVYFSVCFLPPLEARPSPEYRYVHQKPKFAAKTMEAGDYLWSGRTYEAIWPTELITQEMSKKDIKRLFKK